ncbi:MAG TPA: hypothetical protein VME41_11685 [Stellaceae bacterium]|nr:hypothetical protein [Stellaceae bacterium]
MPDDVSGGGASNNPNVEFRLARLETAMDNVQRDLQALREAVARIDGKISNLPTTFQIVFMLAAFTVATFIGATALALAVLRLGTAH